MPESIFKLQPNRDLQCYFLRPSAIAAMSGATESGFTVSGTWRQQFDWAVVEWNRDNVFEHPLFRYLPDGDLSGLNLTYEETRTNCIGMDSDLYPVVDWPTLRVWATPDGGAEEIYYVSLRDHAAPVEGSYQAAFADFTLLGVPTAGSTIGIEFLGQHHTYSLYGIDTLASAAQAIADSVNAFAPSMRATRNGTTVRLHYVGTSGGAKPEISAATTGVNGNRVGAYAYASSTSTVSWDRSWANFSGGASPTKWRVELDFATLSDNQPTPRAIPTRNVRKLRWTYAASLQDGVFLRSEFSVTISNWAVGGTGRGYAVAGAPSRRIENDDSLISYSGVWSNARGNFSGGTIHFTNQRGSSATVVYQAPEPHSLYIGTRLLPDGPDISAVVDGHALPSQSLVVAGEDILVRRLIGTFGAGKHTVTIKHSGSDGAPFYFDFFEVVIPDMNLPAPPAEAKITLATDWDTDHSIALPAERTAWMVSSLGFHGRANHYVGALWFYELHRVGHEYASATVGFSGNAIPSQTVSLTLGRLDNSVATTITHLIHAGDTPETIARAFAMELNGGYTAVRADADGSTLRIWSRSMGVDGNLLTITAASSSSGFATTASGTTFAGGHDGDWRTDTTAIPALNRAARDWSRAYFSALKAAGIDCTAAFSMELQHADPSANAGLAQCGPDGDPILLPTPAIQTNFSPVSRNFWKQVYADMALLQTAAGQIPYLQFGEVQWWYFPSDGLGRAFSGMPFYDEWTKSEFARVYRRELVRFVNNTSDPRAHPEDVAFLVQCISDFTNSVMNHVRESFPAARFEVLYPTDVNQTAFNQAINFASGAWTPVNLASLKTESFGFTLNRDLNSCASTLRFGPQFGFSRSNRSHLIGISDSTTAWDKEAGMVKSAGFESAVLFALDQFCLIGYPAPLKRGLRRGLFMS